MRFGSSPAFAIEVDVDSLEQRMIWFTMMIGDEVFVASETEHAGVVAGGLEQFFLSDRRTRSWAPFFDVAASPSQMLDRLRERILATADPSLRGPRVAAANAAFRSYSFDDVLGYGPPGYERGKGLLMAVSDGLTEQFVRSRDGAESYGASVPVKAVDSAVRAYLEWWKSLD